MHKPMILLTSCLAALSFAAPYDKKEKEAKPESKQPESKQPETVKAPKVDDYAILNYALALEYLERKFYTEGLKKYSEKDFTKAGFSKEFYQNMCSVRDDEKSHVDFLYGALGDKAIKEPKFSFPYKDVKSFVGLSSVLEGVGVSAYLGAAGSIANKDYLKAAGSILTVESRHASFIREALKQKPAPTAYDTPLDFNQVYSLAAQFITGLAPGTKLPFKAFPSLKAEPTKGKTFCAGKTSITFQGAQKAAKKAGKYSDKSKMYAVFYSGLQTYYVPLKASGDDFTATLPGADYTMKGQPAPAGQTYVTLTSADGKKIKASDENTVAGVSILEVGSGCY